MSIVVLKKKSAAKYKNNSVGVSQFSINGTHRSQGWVGQDTLSRSLPKTIMKGNVIKGHGGCCGTYPIKNIVQSAVTSTEDSRVVKSSVLNTSGMISTHYRWIRRPQPYTSVKPDVNNNINSQQQHVEIVKKKALSDSYTCNLTAPVPPAKNVDVINDIPKDQRPRIICPLTKDFANDTNTSKFMNQSDYLMKLNKTCSENLDVVYVPTNTQRTPFVPLHS